jgi:hypothetical protein
MPDQPDLKEPMELATLDAHRLFERVIADLKSLPVEQKGDKPPRLFFPAGIELIYVKVEAGLTEKTKVSVEIKVAGEKGAKGLEGASAAAVAVKEPEL